MGSSANVRDISVLLRVRGELIRFAEESREAFVSAQVESERMLEELTGILKQCRMHLDSCCEELSEAEENLANADEEEQDYWADAAGEARARVYKAEHDLEVVTQEHAHLLQGAQGFERKKQAYLQFMEKECPAAQALLARKTAELETYAQSSAGRIVVPEQAGRNRVSEGNGVASAASTHHWEERGVIEVPLRCIDLSDSWVKTEKQFRDVSPDEMRRGLRLLRDVVWPAVRNGADADYFARLDQRAGVQYSEGLRRVYDAFWGSEPIRLEHIGDRYKVTNGYHRLRIARELGLENIPASVVEKVG